jgi:predicted membrane-bound spermidine synthase
MMELILTRIFSVKLYYHYAFMVISLALFGSGASGVYVYLFPNFFRKEKLDRQLVLFSLLFALSIPLVLWLILQLNFEFSFDPLLMARVFLLYLIPAIPFFLGGICISLAMTHWAQNVSRLYFFDLAGAGLGCLLVILLLNQLGGPDAMLAVALMASMAALSFSCRAGLSAIIRGFAILISAGLLCLLAISVLHPFLKIRHVKGRDEWGVLYSKWNSFSRITVVQVNQDPKNTWIIMDGDAGTLLPDFNGDISQWNYLRNTVSSLAYHLKKDAHPLIIGPGGGIDVLTALNFGNSRITGVEINPIMVNDVMKGIFRKFSGGLYLHPGVEIVVDEGRSFIRRSPQQYDIIQATLVDTWAATAAGAFALTENNLYTVEAFKDYIAKLKEDGILTFTRWNLDPPQQDLRLIAITRQAMQELGLSRPDQSMMVIRKSKAAEAMECNFLFKKSPFTKEEVAKVEEVSRQNHFDILYTPKTRPDNPFTQLITTTDPDRFYRGYPFIVTPTYDNSPFFFHTIRLPQLWQSLFLSWESKKTNVGLLVLFLVLCFSTILTLLFILVPLVRFHGRVLGKGRMTMLSYFICLGLGFILVEMTLVQKFILFLGPPVYALSIVLFSTLLFSGLGSFFSAHFAGERLARNLKLICLAIAAITLFYIWILPFFLYHYVSLPLPAKAGLVSLFLFPLTLLMGMPMPLGIQWLRNHSAEIIPWAWGLNGSASVLGSILTILIAVHFGFNLALMLAAGAYLLAATVLSLAGKKEAA